MPFLDASGMDLNRIHLVHRSEHHSRYYQLVECIRYTDPVTGENFDAPAHDPDDSVDDPGNRTDLASVPPFLWSLIASHGRQSAPAIVHDAQCRVAETMPRREALEHRRKADLAFRRGLRERRVPRYRAWLMWSFVCIQKYARHEPWFAVVLVIALTAVPGLAYQALFTTPSTLSAVIAGLAVLIVAAREPRLTLFLLPSLVVLLPLIAVHVLAALPLRLIEGVGNWGEPDTPVLTPATERLVIGSIASSPQQVSSECGAAGEVAVPPSQ